MFITKAEPFPDKSLNFNNSTVQRYPAEKHVVLFLHSRFNLENN